MRSRAASASLLAALAVAGCVDTDLPGGAAALVPRICSAAELEGFRAASSAQTRDDLWIAFIDVGQGDAIWVRTPGEAEATAREILIDTGDAGDFGRSLGGDAVVDFMTEFEWLPGSPIDYLVVTNPDSDHYSGGRQILANYTVKHYSDTGLVAAERGDDGEINGYGRFIAQVEGAGIDVLRPARTALPPHMARWSNGLMDAVLLSADEFASADGRETAENRASIVMRLDFAGIRILLTGDATKGVLEGLAAGPRKGDLRANVLKVAHHGSKYETTAPFLDAVFPPDAPTVDRYGVFTVGAGNDYGHPGPEVVELVGERAGLRGVYRTDRGDEGKHLDSTMGDDHVIVHVTADGHLSVCYAYPDAPAPSSGASALTGTDLN